MKRPLLVAALGVFCWLVFGANPSSWAVQQPTQSAEERALSDKVQALHRGAQITVFTRAGVKIEGTLREVQADAIVIDNKKGGGSTTILLTDIQKLQTKGKGRTTKVLMIVGVTLGTLFVIAAATC